MIKPGGLIMTVLMVGVAAGTYYGLDYIPIPPPLGRAPPPEQPKLGGGSAFAETTPAQTAAAAPAPATAPEEPAVTEQDLAEEPPPEESAPAPAAPVEPEPSAAAEPEPEPEPAPAPPPKPAATPAPKPAPAPAEAPKAVAKAETPSAPAPTKAQPPEADVIKPWWPNPEKMPANQLKLQYAGQVQGEQAIALLFSAPLNLDSVKQHARVRTVEGADAKGQWELGKNPRLAVYRGVGPGRYTVILQPRIADQKGFMLGTTLQGPVYIQQP